MNQTLKLFTTTRIYFMQDCNLTSNSACFWTSSALILFRMNSASLATRTIWSRVAWDNNLKIISFLWTCNIFQLSLFCFSKFFFFNSIHSQGKRPWNSIYLPSLTSSINANPACFWREFCHSCEHSNITSSTTDVLCFKVTKPEKQDSNKKIYTKSIFYNHYFSTLAHLKCVKA